MVSHETLRDLSFKDQLIAATNLNDLVEVFANYYSYRVIDPQLMTASFLAQESPITNILKEPDLELRLQYFSGYKEWLFELYQNQDLRHRKWFYEDGQLKIQVWRLNGQRHRQNGPAFEWFYDNGQLASQEWYLDGQQLSEKNWLKAVQNNSLNS